MLRLMRPGIKQILMDMAIDMPGYEPYEIGAGAVSEGCGSSGVMQYEEF